MIPAFEMIFAGNCLIGESCCKSCGS